MIAQQLAFGYRCSAAWIEIFQLRTRDGRSPFRFALTRSQNS
jgi:hypothetical protein